MQHAIFYGNKQLLLFYVVCCFACQTSCQALSPRPQPHESARQSIRCLHGLIMARFGTLLTTTGISVPTFFMSCFTSCFLLEGEGLLLPRLSSVLAPRLCCSMYVGLHIALCDHGSRIHSLGSWTALGLHAVNHMNGAVMSHLNADCRDLE